MRTRTAIATAVVVTQGLGVVVSAAVAAQSSSTSGPVTAWFSARGTHPNCKQLWPVTVTVHYRGRPTNATAYYQFLYNGQVVAKVQVFSATRKNPHNRLYHFRGSFYDNTFGPFGALSVGKRILVRAVVQVGRYTVYPGLYVTVVNARGCPART
jgi:hypothetical protein